MVNNAVLGVCLRRAAMVDAMLSPHHHNALSYGREVEAVILMILDGHYVSYKIGRWPEERVALPLLQSHT